MLTVTESASSYDLTTLAAVRNELGLTTHADDPQLKTWITAASKIVSDYTRRTFATETVTETFRLQCRSACLFLSRYPVTAVASIEEAGTALTATDYEVNAETGIVLRLSSDDPIMWSPGKVVVVYTGGYAQADIPEAVQRATIQLVKSYWAAGDRDPMVRSEQNDGLGNVTYYVDPLPPDVAAMLDPHVRPLFG